MRAAQSGARAGVQGTAGYRPHPAAAQPGETRFSPRSATANAVGARASARCTVQACLVSNRKSRFAAPIFIACRMATRLLGFTPVKQSAPGVQNVSSPPQLSPITGPRVQPDSVRRSSLLQLAAHRGQLRRRQRQRRVRILSIPRKHPTDSAAKNPGALGTHRARPGFLHKIGVDGVSPRALDVRTKRLDAPRAVTDGRRVLADRVWPPGITRQEAALDEWLKDLAPSPELRRWFGEDRKRWPEFCTRYRAELTQRQRLLNSLRRSATQQRVTLLYTAEDAQFNPATVLKEVLCAQ